MQAGYLVGIKQTVVCVIGSQHDGRATLAPLVDHGVAGQVNHPRTANDRLAKRALGCLVADENLVPAGQQAIQGREFGADLWQRIECEPVDDPTQGKRGVGGRTDTGAKARQQHGAVSPGLILRKHMRKCGVGGQVGDDMCVNQLCAGVFAE